MFTREKTREVKDYFKPDSQRYILKQAIFRLAIPAVFSLLQPSSAFAVFEENAP